MLSHISTQSYSVSNWLTFFAEICRTFHFPFLPPKSCIKSKNEKWRVPLGLVLPCSLSMCFFRLFSILITLLGEEGISKREPVSVLIVHLFVSYAHVNLCHFFSSSWCRRLAAASACGSSWTFLFTFLNLD